MNTTRTFGERLALAGLRAAATVVTLAGASMLVATLATAAAPFTGTLARLFPAHAFRFAAVLLLPGAAAHLLAAARGAPFGAERLEPRAQPAGPGGWWWGLAISALVAPVLLLWQLRPLAAFWRDAFVMLDRLGAWEFRGSMEMSGLVLAPLFAAAALPAFESFAALAFVAACAFLLLLVAFRSRLRLRAVLVCATLTGALATASLLADDTARQVAPALAHEIGRATAGNAGETAQALAALDRYQRVTGDAARALAWSWIALALWVPFLVLGGLAEARALRAAAVPGGPPPPYDEPAGVPAAARDPRVVDRERFYADAARLVGGGGPGGGGRPSVVALLAAFALLGLFALAWGLGALAAISRIVTR